MESIALVVFDMAGTTVRDQHEVETCFARAADATGLEMTEEEILSVQGWSKLFVFETFWERQLGGRGPGWKPQVDSSFRTFKEILEDHYRTHPVEPTDGCLEVFAYLREHGIRIALTTGFYRRVTDIILDRLGWLDGLDEQRVGTDASLLQMSVASDEVPEGRPAPLMIEKIIRTLGVESARRVINVGDTPSDLESGRRAGCLRSLGVTNGTHSKELLARHPNDGLLPDLRALVPVVEELTAISY